MKSMLEKALLGAGTYENASATPVTTCTVNATSVALPKTYHQLTLRGTRCWMIGNSASDLTRAFTGRTARGVRNRFMAEHGGAAPAAYPHVHHLTAPLRAAARERGDAGGFNLWAGQAHALAHEGPAADIVRSLADEARAAVEAALPRLR